MEVIAIDANLLIYAYNEVAEQHGPAREWLADVFSGAPDVRLPWSSIHAFLRLTIS